MRIKNDVRRRLTIFLLQERMTMAELAKMLQVHANHLSQIVSGKKTTSPTVASKMQEITKGAVLASELKVGADRCFHPPVCASCGQKIKQKRGSYKKVLEEKKDGE
jgi:DNA-binding transcriptional regulator YdaS (Cro superfamily)